MSKSINRILNSTFARNVFRLMTGTFVAQLIPIAITPLLSRYFTPEDFGAYAIFVSLTSVLIILGTGRLEFAIMLPEKDEDAKKIVIIIIGLSFVVSVFIFLMLIIIGSLVLDLLNLGSIKEISYLIPLTVFFSSLNLAIKYLKNRKQSFKSIRNVTISGAVIRAASNVTIVLTNPFHFGLIVSQFVSIIASSYLWLRFEIISLKELIKTIIIKDCLLVLSRFVKILYYLVPGGLINTIAVQMPVFLLTYFYNEAIVGQFSMAQRLISVPLVFIMSAFTDTFRQQASDIYRETGSNRKLFLLNIRRLFFIGIIPFILLFIFAPLFFELFLGEQWIQAGIITRILTCMFFVKFIFIGLSGVVIQVSERYEYEIIWQSLFLILSSLAFIIGHFVFDNIYYSLGLYSMAAIIMYFLDFFIAYKVSKKKAEYAINLRILNEIKSIPNQYIYYNFMIIKKFAKRLLKVNSMDHLHSRIRKIAFRRTYNTEELITVMKSMGMKEGSNIFLHSSWNDFNNYTGTIDDFINAIIDTIGKEGTLIMPAFPLIRKKDSVFDVRKTPTIAGLIPERFRNYSGVKRSINQQHSVCALGPMSDFLVREHHHSITCWDEKSPYYKLAQINALIFSCGLGRFLVGTALHCADSILRYEYPYFNLFFNKEVTYKYIDYNGNVGEHTYLTKSEDTIRKWSNRSHRKVIKKYFDKSFYKRSRLSNLTINVFDANYSINRIIELGKKGITVYTEPNPKEYFNTNQ